MHPHSFPLEVWQCPVKPGMLHLVISPLQVHLAFDSDTRGLSFSLAPEPSHRVRVNAQGAATLAWPGLSGAWEEPCEGGRRCTWCLSRAMAVSVSVETWSEQYCTKRLMWHIAFPKTHVLFTNRT